MDADWAFIPIVTVVGLWAFLIVRSVSRSKVRELQIRERIALIEKGHVPPPEVDPKGFERALQHREYEHRYGSGDFVSRGSFRHRRAGTTLIGVGLGLMIMIAFAGNAPQKAIGVGGFLVMIGLAFLANGFIDQRGGPEKRPAPTDPVLPMQTPKTE